MNEAIENEINELMKWDTTNTWYQTLSKNLYYMMGKDPLELSDCIQGKQLGIDKNNIYTLILENLIELSSNLDRRE